jgi:hypothetical protein
MQKVNGQRMPSNGKSSHCLWQGELMTALTMNAHSSPNATSRWKSAARQLIGFILIQWFLRIKITLLSKK